MNQPSDSTNRREFIRQSGSLAAVPALIAAGSAPQFHVASDDTIQLALVGCGGRGTGAAANALSVKNGRTKLVAMADAFDDRLKFSHRALSSKFSDQMDVPDDRKFVGFDAYKRAMDCLKPGDIAIFATPPAFRWVHFTRAIEKNLNVFMEKPVTVDGPTSKKMFELGRKSVEKNLKVGVGLMCRHCKARNELADMLHNGKLGDILMLRAYRMTGPTGSAAIGKPREGVSDLEWQIRRFHGFLWASGGAVSDFLIHNIDEGCWAKGDWPVEAIASGGRHYRGNNVDQNFDNYSIEYTFGDGTKFLVDGRTIPNCERKFATFVHGSKGSAIFSTSGHAPSKARIFSGQRLVKEEQVWGYGKPEPSPYQLEWDNLIDAIRNDKPFNEVERGVKASLVTSMGRMAAHTGQRITYDQILNCDHEFAPNVASLSFDGPAPLLANEDGTYPVPMPGVVVDREFASNQSA